jgi:hypothetical protein
MNDAGDFLKLTTFRIEASPSWSSSFPPIPIFDHLNLLREDGLASQPIQVHGLAFSDLFQSTLTSNHVNARVIRNTKTP